MKTCSICEKRDGQVFHLPHVIKDLRRQVEQLNITKIPAGNDNAHPKCVNDLAKRIKRTKKRRAL